MIKLHQTPHDFHRYTEYALKRMVADAGFAECRIEALGNLFDVWEIDNLIRTKIIMRETSGFRQLIARAFMRLERDSDRIIHRLLPTGLRDASDCDGFPQSYGLIARKL